MNNGSRRLPGVHRSAALVAVGALILTAIAGATLIGKSEPAQSLTISRISALPASQRSGWLIYLHRSQQQEKIDRAALAAERQGMKDLPPDPPLGPSARSMPLN